MHYLACIQQNYVCSNHHVSANYLFIIILGIGLLSCFVLAIGSRRGK